MDRRRRRRNADVARAVRETRERLSRQPGTPAFDREMLRLHGRAMAGSATVVPLLAVAVAIAGLFAGFGLQIVLWATATSAVHVGMAFYARRTDDVADNDTAITRAKRGLLVGHAMSGLCWAWFAILGCQECQIDQFPVIKAAVLLLAMAASTVFAFALRGALLAGFVLPIVAYAALAARLWLPVEAIMASLIVIALPFFTYVASHLRRSAIMLLSFRTEKDGLIAELETANAFSDEARRRAEEANLAKSRFLASMSHELRTPLNAILGFSEVMSDEVLGPLENDTYREYARDIHHSGQHLLDLINEILDISRIEAGRYQLNDEPVFLCATVEECCHLMNMRARNKDIRLVTRYEPDLPRLVADERALRQITLNLVSNAIKFAPSGGLVEVRVGWTAGGGQYVSVRDNGPGIPPEEIPVVLSTFGQGSIAIKSAEQGTGLGLPIVQGLLHIHGGRFELHSKLRAGTEAVAIFPAARVERSNVGAPRAKKAETA